MKIVWVALGLLVAGIGVGVACGPKETFCYKEGLPCSEVEKMKELDATWDGFMLDATPLNNCFAADGAMFTSVDPCP